MNVRKGREVNTEDGSPGAVFPEEEPWLAAADRTSPNMEEILLKGDPINTLKSLLFQGCKLLFSRA